MKYLIFSYPDVAQARNQKAFQDGVAADLFVPGTTTYANVLKHPYAPLYALPIDPAYSQLFTLVEQTAASELLPVWFASGIIAGNFIIEQPITPLPLYPAVSRKAFCNIPEVLADVEKTFVLRVVVRHYLDGVHSWEQYPDKEVLLKADNSDGEFDYFYNLIAQGANMLDLIRQYLTIRDSEGRFN